MLYINSVGTENVLYKLEYLNDIRSLFLVRIVFLYGAKWVINAIAFISPLSFTISAIWLIIKPDNKVYF